MTAATGAAKATFDPRIIGGLIVAGIIGFIGFWVLTAFAPELTSGRDGGGHALSRSAVGFAGIADVVRAGGHGGAVLRGVDDDVPGADNRDNSLLVLTPSVTTSHAQILERLQHVSSPVLIVLPKHRVLPGFGGRDRVLGVGYFPDAANMLGEPGTYSTDRMTPPRPTKLADLWGTPVRLHLPQTMQILQPNEALTPLITVDGEIVLAEIEGRKPIYVLADPDFLNNLAFHDDDRALAAWQLITAIAQTDDAPIAFDVTLNGLGANGRSLLRSAFVPPFLGFTLCLIVAGLLALWQGFIRFGPPDLVHAVRQAGKKGLVDTSARLIVQARRARHFGGRYGALTRDVVARRLHAPTTLKGAALDAWLDRFPDTQGRHFTALISRLDGARSEGEMLEHASALAQWRRDVLRDNR